MKKTHTKTALLILLALCTAILLITGCGKASKKTTVNFNKYAIINASGYDQAGTLNIDFDYDAFVKDYDGKITLTEEGKVQTADVQKLFNCKSDAETFIYVCLTNLSGNKEESLSNGDKVTCTWDVDTEAADKYFNCELTCSDIEYTVKGLEEAPAAFNPFEHITFEFVNSDLMTFTYITETPISGKTKIKFNKDDSPEMEWMYFVASKDTSLKNGDVITITAYPVPPEKIGTVNPMYFGQKYLDPSDPEGFAETFGEILSPTTLEYTVEGLPYYITDISDLTDADIQRISETLVEKLKEEYGTEKVECLGYDLNIWTNMNWYILPYRNYFNFVCKVTASGETFYKIIGYESYIVMTDGYSDINDIEIDYRNFSSLENALNALQDVTADCVDFRDIKEE